MFKLKIFLLGAFLLVAATSMPSETRAQSDHCREYTRTVTIGNRLQDAYGTACLQPDGSWMIVGEGLSSDIPDDANNVTYVINDDGRRYAPNRVVYYDAYPEYYYARQPEPVFVWNRGGHYRNGIFHSYNRPVYYSPNRYSNRFDNRYDRHDRRDWHDRKWNNRNDGYRRDRYENRGGYDPRERNVIRRYDRD